MTLSRLVKPWTYPFDLTSGQLEISIACRWKPIAPGIDSSLGITRGDVTVALSHIDGYYDNVLIDDVNAKINIIANDLNNFATLSPAIVSVGSVNAGVVATDTTFEMNLRLGEGDALPIVEGSSSNTPWYASSDADTRDFFPIDLDAQSIGQTMDISL